jgi:hypothetical protein
MPAVGIWRPRSLLALPLVLLLGGACGGDGDEATTATTATTAAVTTTRAPANPAPTFVRTPPPEGVETYAVEAFSHTNEPVVYPQTPPVGGPHHLSWETCVFRDRPVPNETAVHSLEHGAIWVTYRPDLPPDQIAVLRRLAESRRDMLVSRWDEGLPAPVVASSWGRQLKLESAGDPRLVQFAQAFSGQSPEPNAPC